MNPQETGSKHRSKKNERGVILVLDDDPAVLTSLKFALELEGYIVKAFSTAQSLLRHRIGRHVCLVIDYRLPDTDGLDLLQRLRAKGVVAPAVLITSDPSEEVKRRASKLQMPIVEKPFLGNSLVTTIRKQSELVAAGQL